ncbi:ATP-NAD kinase family protein [Labrys neptuniae]
MNIKQNRLGLVVNPLAGLGGRVGLKGSDGADIVAQALARGALPATTQRAAAALAALAGGAAEILTAGVGMGEDACRLAGVEARIAYQPKAAGTGAEDTVAAIQAFLAEGVDLIVFAGGDGTARDILSVTGPHLPLVGIPAGVKMYSGVFALSPVHAGQLAVRFLADPNRPCREAEILDIDEDSLRRGRPATRLFGYASVPQDAAMQIAKAVAAEDEDSALHRLCLAAAQAWEPGHLHVVGPGSTMQRLLAAAGLTGTLLGVDLVLDGAVAARDVGEAAILGALDQRPGIIHVGVIGGTGCLFGRGNQPISPAVLRRVGREHIRIIATPAKLAALGPDGLFVDTGEAAVDAMLSGYVRVETAPGRSMLVRVRG